MKATDTTVAVTNSRSRRGIEAASLSGHVGSRAEQRAAGKALRERCPRDTHSKWKAPKDRRDAVATVLAAEEGRMPDLLPLRHGRMVRSPFTFYRGSALAMAGNLASTP